jgi:hypothetical protein
MAVTGYVPFGGSVGSEWSMRKLLYDVAVTVDNFIAHEDGSTDGFVEGDRGPDYLARLVTRS